MEFFGDSVNCGEFIGIQAFAGEIGVEEAAAKNVVLQLRELRWDVRLPETHPTIRRDALICTYPFPLLSGKAQLERRVNVIS